MKIKGVLEEFHNMRLVISEEGTHLVPSHLLLFDCAKAFLSQTHIQSLLYNIDILKTVQVISLIVGYSLFLLDERLLDDVLTTT